MPNKTSRIDLFVKELTLEQLTEELKKYSECDCRQTLCKYCAINREIKLRGYKIKAAQFWGKKESEKFFRK